jgi:hypothetical protein
MRQLIYASIPAFSAQLFLRLLGALVFVHAWIIYHDLDLIAGRTAIITAQSSLSFLSNLYKSSTSVTMLLAILSVCGGCLLCVRHTRIACITAYSILLVLSNQASFLRYGGYGIMCASLFFMSFQHVPSQTNKTPLMLTSWPVRILQYYCCVLYAKAGLCKILDPEWGTGEASRKIFTYLAGPLDYSWLAHWSLAPYAETAITYLELLFPILIWTPVLNEALIMSLLLMHIFISSSLHILFFNEASALLLILFWNRTGKIR